MANKLYDGPVPGASVQDIMNWLKTRSGGMDRSFILTCGAMTNGKTTKKQWKTETKGKITAIYVTSSNTAAVGTATLAVSCGGSNALNAATYDMTAPTLNTQTALTLTSTAANLQFDSGDVIEATWVTSGGSGTITDAQILVQWEPID